MAPVPRPSSARRQPAPVDPRLILVLALVLIGLALVLIYLTREKQPSAEFQARNDALATHAAQMAGIQPLTAAQADFTLPDPNGGKVALADFRGRYVLVNFWASWCPPCIDEMPVLNAYYLAHKDQGFALVAVNNMEDAATVRAFIQQNNFQFPVALDLDSAVFERYDVQNLDSLPISYLIDPQGNVVPLNWPPGRLTMATLERDVTPLLEG